MIRFPLRQRGDRLWNASRSLHPFERTGAACVEDDLAVFGPESRTHLEHGFFTDNLRRASGDIDSHELVGHSERQRLTIGRPERSDCANGVWQEARLERSQLANPDAGLLA